MFVHTQSVIRRHKPPKIKVLAANQGLRRFDDLICCPPDVIPRHLAHLQRTLTRITNFWSTPIFNQSPCYQRRSENRPHLTDQKGRILLAIGAIENQKNLLSSWGCTSIWGSRAIKYLTIKHCFRNNLHTYHFLRGHESCFRNISSKSTCI